MQGGGGGWSVPDAGEPNGDLWLVLKEKKLQPEHPVPGVDGWSQSFSLSDKQIADMNIF